jgi:hypothetical protein
MFNPIKFLTGSKLDAFLQNLLDNGRKLFKKLSELEQQLAKQVSGIVAIVNAHLTNVPDVVYLIIQSFFPELSKDLIVAAMAKVNAFVANVAGYQVGTFEEELTKLQAYLAGFTEDNKWIAATKFVINLFIIAFEPSTVLHKIEAVMEYVYRTFYKGKVVVPA